MPDRRLRIQTGYPDGTHPSPRAYDANLRERFAAVLATERTEAEGMFLDVEHFLCLIDAMLEVVPHDQVLFELGEERTAAPADGDGAPPRRLPSAALEPPEQIILARAAQVVGVVETECRVSVGGAGAYHDTYAVALYTRGDYGAALRAACERFAATQGVPIDDEAEGVARREPFVSFWRRPLQWVGRKAW